MIGPELTRPAVLMASIDSGVPVELLTTHADLFSGPHGLPDAAPYNEVVCLINGIDKDHPERRRWEAYLDRLHRSSHSQ